MVQTIIHFLYTDKKTHDFKAHNYSDGYLNLIFTDDRQICNDFNAKMYSESENPDERRICIANPPMTIFQDPSIHIFVPDYNMYSFNYYLLEKMFKSAQPQYQLRIYTYIKQSDLKSEKFAKYIRLLHKNYPKSLTKFIVDLQYFDKHAFSDKQKDDAEELMQKVDKQLKATFQKVEAKPMKKQTIKPEKEIIKPKKEIIKPKKQTIKPKKSLTTLEIKIDELLKYVDCHKRIPPLKLKFTNINSSMNRFWNNLKYSSKFDNSKYDKLKNNCLLKNNYDAYHLKKNKVKCKK